MRHNKIIKGIKVNNTKNKSSHYADDTELFLERDRNSILKMLLEQYMTLATRLVYFLTQGKQMQYGQQDQLTSYMYASFAHEMKSTTIKCSLDLTDS